MKAYNFVFFHQENSPLLVVLIHSTGIVTIKKKFYVPKIATENQEPRIFDSSCFHTE